MHNKGLCHEISPTHFPSGSQQHDIIDMTMPDMKKAPDDAQLSHIEYPKLSGLRELIMSVICFNEKSVNAFLPNVDAPYREVAAAITKPKVLFLVYFS